MVQGIEIVRGTTVPISLEVTDANGLPYTAAAGEVILFGIKKEATDAAPIFCKAAVAEDDEPGVYSFTITPENTKGLTPGRYYYDVGLESGGEFYNIIEPGPFMILPNITGKGDAYA